MAAKTISKLPLVFESAVTSIAWRGRAGNAAVGEDVRGKNRKPFTAGRGADKRDRSPMRKKLTIMLKTVKSSRYWREGERNWTAAFIAS